MLAARISLGLTRMNSGPRDGRMLTQQMVGHTFHSMEVLERVSDRILRSSRFTTQSFDFCNIILLSSCRNQRSASPPGPKDSD